MAEICHYRCNQFRFCNKWSKWVKFDFDISSTHPTHSIRCTEVLAKCLLLDVMQLSAQYNCTEYCCVRLQLQAYLPVQRAPIWQHCACKDFTNLLFTVRSEFEYVESPVICLAKIAIYSRIACGHNDAAIVLFLEYWPCCLCRTKAALEMHIQNEI